MKKGSERTLKLLIEDVDADGNVVKTLVPANFMAIEPAKLKAPAALTGLDMQQQAHQKELKLAIENRRLQAAAAQGLSGSKLGQQASLDNSNIDRKQCLKALSIAKPVASENTKEATLDVWKSLVECAFDLKEDLNALNRTLES